jgi:hypothetical protein
MNEGIFRDQPKACGLCQEPLQSKDSIEPKELKEGTMVHVACWKKLTNKLGDRAVEALRNQMKEDNVSCDYCDRWAYRAKAAVLRFFLVAGISFVILSLFSFGLWCLWNVANASGRVEYCYVEADSGSPPRFALKGQVNWRTNNHMGSFNTPQEAMKAGLDMKCYLGSVQQ